MFNDGGAGLKLKWLLANVPLVREKADKGEAMFGTVDSWLIYKMTGEHVTDPSCAPWHFPKFPNAFAVLLLLHVANFCTRLFANDVYRFEARTL